MDRIFKSKVGAWFHLALWLLIVVTVLLFVQGASPIGMVVMLLFTLMTIHMLGSTWYKITADGQLIAHCSIFPEKRVAIADITAIEVTSLPVSSYALSFDRLIIYKNNVQWLLISPVNKKEFIRLLRKHNPEIQIKEPMI